MPKKYDPTDQKNIDRAKKLFELQDWTVTTEISNNDSNDFGELFIESDYKRIHIVIYPNTINDSVHNESVKAVFFHELAEAVIYQHFDVCPSLRKRTVRLRDRMADQLARIVLALDV